MLKLLIHQWKEDWRSPAWQKSVWVNILLGIFAMYLMLNFIFIGYFADQIILEVYNGVEVVGAFTGFLFFYFAFDLILRFLFQQLPVLSIQPYLTLPINKSKLLHYPLIKSVSSFFNIMAILLLSPFFFKVVCATRSVSFCLVWGISVLSLIATNNFLNFSLKKFFSKRPLLMLLLLALVGASLYFDIAGKISFSRYFSIVLLYLSETTYLGVIPVLMAVFSYLLGYQILKRNSYIEDTQTNQHIKANSFSFFARFGETGHLMRNELKLILRNKRPKSVLYVSAIFLLYGLLFYQKERLDDYLMLILIGFIMTSIFSINYGQFLFSWEGSFFDSYLSNKISVSNYIRSKYLFFAGSSILCFLFTLPYVLISYRIGIVNVAMVLYNIGISSIVLMYFSTYNTTRIELGKSQFMNYQGTGIMQFILILPLLGFPIVVYLLGNLFGKPMFSIYALGIIGIIGIIFNKYLLQMVANQFSGRKYKMAAGFRLK